MRKILFLLLISCVCLYSQEEINNSKKFNILFIGNSLTYTNKLPKLVKKRAKLKGININTKMIALPNYSIEDHWKEKKVQKLISTKKYDFVIIQQGPSSLSDGRKMLIKYGKKYSQLCKLSEVKLC